MDSRDLLLLGAVAVVLWLMFGKRACCGACAAGSLPGARAPMPSTGLTPEEKAQARGCSPFACGR